MANKRAFPSPISILMLVIILAAICTWLLPAGQYSKLSLSAGKAFIVTAPSSEMQLPLTQKTLDSLGIGIPVQKFIDGDIRKPVSIPGTYQKLEKNQQGFIEVLEAPIKGIMESIDIILFILIIGGFMYVFNETG
ncbi:MAG: YfcC family protein, partial [Phycisphaerae bacterium]|nr:YfcC family protein [Saprospiraceae bacterium]